jgi:hypothetical protein
VHDDKTRKTEKNIVEAKLLEASVLRALRKREKSHKTRTKYEICPPQKHFVSRPKVFLPINREPEVSNCSTHSIKVSF